MLWLSVVFLAAVPAEISPEPWRPPQAAMISIHQHVPRDAPTIVRLRLLHKFLTSSRGLGVRQVSDWSGSSAEVWRQRRADCVGFAYLFGGLARELSINISFAIERRWSLPRRSVPRRPLPRRSKPRSGLRVEEAHVSVLYEEESGARWLIDHGGFRLAPADVNRIRDSEAAALLPANRGARALIAGDCVEAYSHARLAWLRAPSLGELKRNLRAIERRCSIGI